MSGESRGNGVYRSTDGGETWQPMWQGLTHLRVYDIVISPQYAADKALLAYAHYYDLTQQGSGDSLFRTTDGGEHWNLMAAQPVNEPGDLPRPEDLLPLPERSVQFRVLEYGTGIERSIDGGQTWEIIRVFKETPGWWGRIQNVVASPTFEQDHTVYALGGNALYRSRDSGDTWQVLLDKRIGDQDDSNYLRVIELSTDQDGRHYIFLGSANGDFLVVQPETSDWTETDVLIPPS